MIHHLTKTRQRQAAFTLVEMTIVIMVIAILAALAIPVFATAAQQARVHRTRAIIAKLDQIIGEKYESYRTRQVPVRVAPGTRPVDAAWFRVRAMRELQRFELPDRVTDVTAGPAYGTVMPDMIPQSGFPVYALDALNARPALNRQYLRYAFKAHAPAGSPPGVGLQYWTGQHENAECLYIILATSRDGDRNALDWFSKTEIGDTDDDGMNEILDAWGQPIAFLRWAPAYRADVAPYPVTPQRRNDSGLAADPTAYADVFDPFKVDGRWSDNNLLNDPITLKPLIWSSGPDKKHGINVATPVLPIPPGNTNPSPYAISTPANDPYFYDPNVQQPIVGAVVSPDASDNITNHDLEAK